MTSDFYSLLGFEKGYTQGEADTIKACARAIASLDGMCANVCPFKCYRGTEATCADKWAIYFAEKIKEGDNGFNL